DPAEQRRRTTSIVVGGGPTGVEMAGAIAELARWSLRRDFRNIDPTTATTLLLEAGERILPPIPGKARRLRAPPAREARCDRAHRIAGRGGGRRDGDGRRRGARGANDRLGSRDPRVPGRALARCRVRWARSHPRRGRPV